MLGERGGDWSESLVIVLLVLPRVLRVSPGAEEYTWKEDKIVHIRCMITHGHMNNTLICHMGSDTSTIFG